VATVTLREACRGDELAVAELHVRSWQEAYRELMPAEFLAGLDPHERAARYDFEGGEDAPMTVLAVGLGGEGGAGDPSLTNSVEVRSGSPSPASDRAPVLGFVTFGPSRDADTAGLGEIYALYVDPDRYGGGLGRMLMADARERLRETGIDEAILWVLRGNERAQRFYSAEGWTPDGATRLEQPYGIVSNVIRFRRTLD
jgi:ribosomal protein S18 acetylase RimI-like enzyme